MADTKRRSGTVTVAYATGSGSKLITFEFDEMQPQGKWLCFVRGKVADGWARVFTPNPDRILYQDVQYYPPGDTKENL